MPFTSNHCCLFTTSQNPFKQEIREYPVDFAFPLFMDKYVVNIQVPDGFKIDSILKPVVSMEDGFATFKFFNKCDEQLSSSIIFIPDKYFNNWELFTIQP
jgi:hypothetical protein